jgi:hypothetical protein
MTRTHAAWRRLADACWRLKVSRKIRRLVEEHGFEVSARIYAGRKEIRFRPANWQSLPLLREMSQLVIKYPDIGQGPIIMGHGWEGTIRGPAPACNALCNIMRISGVEIDPEHHMRREQRPTPEAVRERGFRLLDAMYGRLAEAA